MYATMSYPDNQIKGPYSIEKLSAEVSRFGSRALVVADPVVFDDILPNYLSQLENRIAVEKICFPGKFSEEEVNRLAGSLKVRAVDVLIGFGNRYTLDTVRVIGQKLEKPVIIIPSLACLLREVRRQRKVWGAH